MNKRVRVSLFIRNALNVTVLSVSLPVFLLTRGTAVPSKSAAYTVEVSAFVPTAETAITPIFLARRLPIVSVAEFDVAIDISGPDDVRWCLVLCEMGVWGRIRWGKNNDNGSFPFSVRIATPFEVAEPRMDA